jgi:hypothetical protein
VKIFLMSCTTVSFSGWSLLYSASFK